jgi:predicted Zn-dependent protease
MPLKNLLPCRLTALSLAVAIASSGLGPAAAQSVGRGIDNLPALGEASVDELSPAAEQRLGDQIFQEFLRMGVVHDDPEVTDLLTRQANRLLAASGSLGHSQDGRPFRFFLVRDSSINAFALPGGYIGVHTGLITASDRESEVMSVLAHEIGHVTQRHIARMFGQQRQTSAVMIAAAVLAAMAAKGSPDAAMGVLSLGQTVAIREQLAFSRDAEREADRVGLQILAESGFNPTGMSSMFERLSQAGRLYDNNAPAYLRTHPLTTDRIADIQSRLQSDPGIMRIAQQTATQMNSAGFDWSRAKLTALADTKVDGLRTARQRFDVQLNDPKNNSAAQQGPIHFGIAWAALSQRDFTTATQHHQWAEEAAASSGLAPSVGPLLAFLRLQIAIQSATTPEQKAALRVLAGQSVMRYADSRALLRSAAEAYLLGGAIDNAAQTARIVTQQWSWDPQAWALLGRAESMRGKRTAQHAAIAEQYALSGAYAAAIEQLTLARTAADADFITMSKVDARLTTMRAMLRREQLERQQSGR